MVGSARGSGKKWGLGSVGGWLGGSLPVIPSTARDLLSAPPARSLAALGMTSEPGGHAGPDCCPHRAHPAPQPHLTPPPPATHPTPPNSHPHKPPPTNQSNIPPNPPTQSHEPPHHIQTVQ